MRLRNVVVILGLFIVLALMPVQAAAAVAPEASPAGERPVFQLWDAAVEWFAGWLTASTSDGEPTDLEGIEPLAPIAPGGGDQTTTSGGEGEIDPGLDPDG